VECCPCDGRGGGGRKIEQGDLGQWDRSGAGAMGKWRRACILYVVSLCCVCGLWMSWGGGHGNHPRLPLFFVRPASLSPQDDDPSFAAIPHMNTIYPYPMHLSIQQDPVPTLLAVLGVPLALPLACGVPFAPLDLIEHSTTFTPSIRRSGTFAPHPSHPTGLGKNMPRRRQDV